ncbi:MAG: hypothetical protein ACJA0G_001785 [Kangiellaceae bacterium]|jgi:hypothetical protein
MIFSRVQGALKHHIFEYNGESIALAVTVSIGACVVSQIPQQRDENEQKLLLNSIIKNADNKVYQAN